MHDEKVMHEQKFKDSLSNRCQISSERRVLDFESYVPSSILTEGNICFHVVKPLMPIFALFANVVCL